MISTISSLPTPPNRNDSVTFSDRADALLGAMPTLVTELNNFVSEVNTLSFKTPCRVATTTNITLSGTQTIDGVSVTAGDRVLVKDQNTASQNGVYIVGGGSWVRALDMDTAAEVAGSFVPITFGALQGGKIYYTTFNATGGVLGTTAIPWNSLTDASITGVGTLAVANGGTGLGSYTAGDLLYASAATTLTKLNAAASGNVLKSGSTPSWGKVDLANDVTGTISSASLPASSTSTSGIVRLATSAEVATGTATDTAISPATLRSNGFVRTTETSLSATSSAFIYFPTWVRRLTVILRGVSLSGTQGALLQLGTSLGYSTSNYESHNAVVNSGTGQYSGTTSYVIIPAGVSAVVTYTGHFILTAINSTTWVGSGVMMYSGVGAGAMQMLAGSNSLGPGTDRVNLYVPSGTFDAGTVTFIYE